MLPKQTDYKVGMYLRLSRDDERQGESLSIENQRRILTNYVQENGWSIYDTYIDDGISGTTFERPGVQRLLDDANSDSASMDMMPIMNVFNEWHCANTSKKLRTVFHANAKAGKYMATFCTYGYYKADDDKRTPLIDPEAAAVVQRIFKMRASGMGHKSIADALNQEHITPPLDYKYDKLGRTYPLYSHHLWNAQTIRRILDNQMYLGKLVQMKETTVSYKNHKVIRNDESEWVIVENNHEPIISQELWDKVRERDRSTSLPMTIRQGRNTSPESRATLLL